MSSFSSVVRKPNQKITPKSAPRRNVQRPNSKSTTGSSVRISRVARENSVIDGTHGDTTEEQHGQFEQSGREEQDASAADLVSAARSVEKAAVNLETVSEQPHQQPTTSATTLDHTTIVSIEPSALDPTAQTVERSARGNEEVGNIPIVITSTVEAGRPHSLVQSSDSEFRPHIVIGAEEHNVDEPRKRRRITPRGGAVNTTRTGSPEEGRSLRATPEVVARSTSSLPPPDDEPAERLLRSATARAATVSDLANSIDNGLRSLRPRSTTSELNDGRIQSPATSLPSSRTTRQQAVRDRNIANIASAIVQRATSGGRISGTRSSTPENAEEHEIEPEVVKMGDLTKDTKLGKRSDRDRKIEVNWSQIQLRRKEQLAQARESSKGKFGRQISAKYRAVEEAMAAIPAEIPVPETTIVNGQIVVRDESRMVDFGAKLQQVVARDADTALEDAKIFKHVHQGTIGKVGGLQRAGKWDQDSTDLFYKGLRMFGTDFMMIANLFPNLTRKQIKLKYVREERNNLARIRANLVARESIGLNEYSKMTNLEFNDPQQVQLEIEADERRLREEDEKRRREEGFVHDGIDAVVESQEQGMGPTDGETADEDGDRDRTVSVRPSTDRFEAEAARIVAAAVASKKKRPKGRDVGKGKTTKRVRKSMEGVEERIGPIDEVDR